jgi:hypothetical protein
MASIQPDLNYVAVFSPPSKVNYYLGCIERNIEIHVVDQWAPEQSINGKKV